MRSMSFVRRNLLVLLSKLSCFTKTTIAGLSVFRSIKGAFFDLHTVAPLIKFYSPRHSNARTCSCSRLNASL